MGSGSGPEAAPVEPSRKTSQPQVPCCIQAEMSCLGSEESSSAQSLYSDRSVTVTVRVHPLNCHSDPVDGCCCHPVYR